MRKFTSILLILTCLIGCSLSADTGDEPMRFELFHSDSGAIVSGGETDTVKAFGSVSFGMGEGIGYCDSAAYALGKLIRLWGNVIIDDPDYRIVADSVSYGFDTYLIYALGEYVELHSKNDSIFAVGTHAMFDRITEGFRMWNRPTLYLGYPDTSRMIEVVADTVDYHAQNKKAISYGDVLINGQQMEAQCGQAIMYPFENRLELYREPVIKRQGSYISGKSIFLESEEGQLKNILVQDSAYAEFDEPIDSLETFTDQSRLRGRQMLMEFENDKLKKLTCINQAYSWYLPSSRGKTEQNENTASGDTITFHISDEQLIRVDVAGGALGTYVSSQAIIPSPSIEIDTLSADDTLSVMAVDSTTNIKVDTIDYRAENISYFISDSLITLDKYAHVTSGGMVLEAARIAFDTRRRVIEAWSAYSEDAEDQVDSIDISYRYEPNEVPVVLRDGAEEFYGDYLEYSIDTEKGRIVQSKSAVERGTYYGDNAYRAQKRIFYVRDGHYTPCDINYLHFASSSMKFIQGERLIAKPVVMYVNRIPVMALPYYVFPLEKGRHSGFLPFTLGNFEEGDRYIRNLGYYWAASEYWDYQGAMDYYDRNSTINFFSRLRYNKRYVFSGSISSNATMETNYNQSMALEQKATRWTISGDHKHEISPSFRVTARGSYQSDSRYYQDYSANLDERLNRTLRSQINFSKKFGRSVSLSGAFKHDVNLDTESRSGLMPNMSLSLPAVHPFGVGEKTADGTLDRAWYQNLTLTLRPRLTNFSRRDTRILEIIPHADTAYVPNADSISVDTVITWLPSDTLKYRTRKEYARVDNGVSVTLPLTIFQYLTLTPNASYTENWYQIFKTDQSDSAGINAGGYRTYGMSMGVGLKTNLYGTVAPNIMGLKGVRQVVTPSVSYSYTPLINMYPEIRGYAGGGAGSTNASSSIRLGLSHVYQIKIASGESDRVLELLSINHSTSFSRTKWENPAENLNSDFSLPNRYSIPEYLEDSRERWSNISTSFRSQAIPKVNIWGSLVHSPYEPGTDNLNFLSPYLENFTMNASISLSGQRFFLDDPQGSISRGADSAAQISSPERPGSGFGGSSSGKSAGGGSGWSSSISYSYSESGRGNTYRKSASIRFNLRFNLTSQTSVSYSQYYNFERGRTINSQIQITRQLNCWTGNIYWVPIGSNQGWGFRLFVTAIPDIKIDNSQNPLSSGYFQSLRQ